MPLSRGDARAGLGGGRRGGRTYIDRPKYKRARARRRQRSRRHARGAAAGYNEAFSLRLSPSLALSPSLSHLVFRVEQLELLVDEAVLGALLLAQRPLLLELRAPEGLDAVHRAAQLLVGQLELLLQVAQLALQVVVLVLQLPDVARGAVAQQVGVRALALRDRAHARRRVELVLEVARRAAQRLPDGHELALVVQQADARAVQAGVARARHHRPRGAARPVPARALRHAAAALLQQHHRAAELVLARAAQPVVGAAADDAADAADAAEAHQRLLPGVAAEAVAAEAVLGGAVAAARAAHLARAEGAAAPARVPGPVAARGAAVDRGQLAEPAAAARRARPAAGVGLPAGHAASAAAPSALLRAPRARPAGSICGARADARRPSCRPPAPRPRRGPPSFTHAPSSFSRGLPARRLRVTLLSSPAS